METTVKSQSRPPSDTRPAWALPRPPAHRLPALPDDSSCSKGGNLDVSLQLHLFLRPEEVLLLQFAEDSTLSLQGQMGGGGVIKGGKTGPLRNQEPRTSPLWNQELVLSGTKEPGTMDKSTEESETFPPWNQGPRTTPL